MDLYILRHGIAEEPRATGGDAARRLTPEGIKKTRQAAKGMLAMDLNFDLVLASPFLRAKETAEIVAKIFKLEKHLAFSKHLAPDGNPKELLDELKREFKKHESILLVGHEPFLSRLISLLISGDTAVPITLKKGGLCKLTTRSLHYGRCATLEWLLTPGQNRRMR
jgi:phosphohistidine phosphatase